MGAEALCISSCDHTRVATKPQTNSRQSRLGSGGTEALQLGRELRNHPGWAGQGGDARLPGPPPTAKETEASAAAGRFVRWSAGSRTFMVTDSRALSFRTGREGHRGHMGGHGGVKPPGKGRGVAFPGQKCWRHPLILVEP